MYIHFPKRNKIINTKVVSLLIHVIQMYWKERAVCITTGQSYWKKIGKTLWTISRVNIKCITQSRTFWTWKYTPVIICQSRDINCQLFKIYEDLWSTLSTKHPPQSKGSLFPANTCFSEFFLHCQYQGQFSINQRFLLLEKPLISLLKECLNKGGKSARLY